MPKSAHDTTIPARGKALVDTDIAIAVPAGTCTCHAPCSRVTQLGHIRRVANSGPGAVQMAELLLGADSVRAHSFFNADFSISVLNYLPEASKHFIDTGAGVIDADYRGQVKVLLFNHSDTDFKGRPNYTIEPHCRMSLPISLPGLDLLPNSKMMNILR